MTVGARLGGFIISEIAVFREFSNRTALTTDSQRCNKQKRQVNERSQRRMAKLIKINRNSTKTAAQYKGGVQESFSEYTCLPLQEAKWVLPTTGQVFLAN